MSEPSSLNVKYGEVPFDLPIETSLEQLRLLFNKQCEIARSKDPASLSYKPIPADHRAWIRGRGELFSEWMEIFDDDFKDLLSHFASGPYHILFGDVNSPSPNNSPFLSPLLSASSAPSLQLTQDRASVRDLFPAPQNSIDPLSLQCLEDIEANDRMILAYRDGSKMTVVLVSCSYLLAWIRNELLRQRSVFELILDGFETSDGAPLPPLKTGHVIWTQLMSSRCPLRASFRDLYVSVTVLHATHRDELAALKADETLMAGAGLYRRLQFLVRDLVSLELKHLEYMGDSEQSINYCHISLSPYFLSPSEAKRLACFPGRDANLFADIVGNFLRDKAAKSYDGTLCSSHDIAPLYRQVFGLDYKFYGSEPFESEYAKFVKARDKEIKMKQQQAERKIMEEKEVPPPPKVLDKNDEKYLALEAQLTQLNKKIAALEQECAGPLKTKEAKKLQGKLDELNKQRLRLEKKLGIESASGSGTLSAKSSKSRGAARSPSLLRPNI